MNLLLDLELWGLVLVGAGVAAQWWRSERRAIWQLGLRDLLVLTGVAGLGFAWLADQRTEYIAWGFSAAGPSGPEGPTFRPFLSAAPPVWRCVSFCSFLWV